MYKQYLLNSIIKEMHICKRLYTKIPADKMDFRPKEGMRSIAELLQYLSGCGTGTLLYWYRTDNSDFKTFFTALRAKTAGQTPEQFMDAMEAQVELVKKIFEKISTEDLHNKIVDYPWGTTAPLGEAIIETSIKWLTGYKLQLFTYIKLSSDQKLTTPDAWRITELTA